MKKNIFEIINILMLIPLYYFTESNNMFLFTFGLILYLLINSMFKNVSFKKILKKYYDNNYFFTKNKLFFFTSITLIIFNILIGGILYLAFYYLNAYLQNEYLLRVILFMSINIFVVPEIKLIQEFINVHNVNRDIIKIFYLVRNLIVLILLLLNITIKIDNYTFIIWLFLSNLISFILIMIYLYFVFFKYKKRYHLKEKRLLEEKNINIFKDIKLIFTNNFYDTFITFISYLYLYIGIIFLYLSLRYNYNYTNEVLSYTYLYLILIPLLIYRLFRIYQSKIKNVFNFIINKFLILILLLMVTSNSLLFLIYGNDIYSDVFVFELLFIFFYIIYIVIIENIMKKGNKRVLFYISIPGIMVKLILTMPLIDSFKLMGYNVVLGSITASILGLLVSSILGFIVMYNRKMVNFNSNINVIFDFIYKNIIFISLLLIFRLIIGNDYNTRLDALIEIILYMVFICGYLYVCNLLGKKDN